MIIYRHTCNISTKSYIGQTIFLLENRWKEHCGDAKRKSNTKFHRAIRKYGTDCWTHEILEEISDINLLNEREIYWIAYYDTFNNGYNSTKGGFGHLGFKHTIQSIEKMKLTKKLNPYKHSKETRELMSINHTRKHKPLSDETKQKMRMAKLGKPKSLQHRLNMSKAHLKKHQL